jgi:EAL domain-containing protein (putative c-di-GMP-specific phosphodiesterase class I)
MQDTIPGFKVSFNISYIQVLKSDVLTDIVKGVKEYDLDPSLLIVELTESGFIESNDRFLSFCQGLKDNGVSLYLDDFGTGYSNFHYLADIAPKTIKVDRTFTLKALKNTYEESLLKHIIDMVHGIKLEMCVEGIETEEELTTISRLGPDYIQGYYFGRPCPKGEFMERFAKPA